MAVYRSDAIGKVSLAYSPSYVSGLESYKPLLGPILLWASWVLTYGHLVGIDYKVIDTDHVGF